MAEAEHYVGTRGGGMDQTVILMGQEGAACKIDFFPIRVEQVPLLSDYSLVICNSLVKAEKTGDMLHRYNAGPRLSRLICALVEKHVQNEFDEDIELERLGDLWNGALCLTSREVEDLFAEVFRKDQTTLTEAASRLGLATSEIRERWLGDLAEPSRGFRLRARAHHQLTEYRRVESARDALMAQDPFALGELMNASHRSCADDYEISCPELEELVSVAREAGALGARLTGAGFGGCTVSLVAQEDVPRFRAQVRKWYYEGYLGSRGVSVSGDAVFTAESSQGASYL
jgi:N-acetylgalactosamine kinase